MIEKKIIRVTKLLKKNFKSIERLKHEKENHRYKVTSNLAIEEKYLRIKESEKQLFPNHYCIYLLQIFGKTNGHLVEFKIFEI